MTKYLVLFTFVLSLNAFGQLKQKMADQHYALLEFSMCVEMYDELAQKCIDEKKNANWENVRRAAIAHFKLFEMDRSSYYFSKLQGKNLLTEADREFYIRITSYNVCYTKLLRS